MTGHQALVLVRPLCSTLLLAAALAGTAAAGCAPVENAPAPQAITPLDEATFKCLVEPILVRDCSYVACHGVAGPHRTGLALRVYSVGKLRADPAARTLDALTEPLTAEERHANYLSAVAFNFGSVKPEQNWLVLKPMPSASGGFEHIGGAIYTGPEDDRVVSIQTWLSGRIQPCAPVGPP